MTAAAHRCQWPGCERTVPASLWGCAPHWRRIPGRLKTALQSAYTLGQEADHNLITDRYQAVYREIQAWIGSPNLAEETVEAGGPVPMPAKDQEALTALTRFLDHALNPARQVDPKANRKTGFILVTYPFDFAGPVSYMSNDPRAAAVHILRRVLDNLAAAELAETVPKGQA